MEKIIKGGSLENTVDEIAKEIIKRDKTVSDESIAAVSALQEEVSSVKSAINDFVYEPFYEPKTFVSEEATTGTNTVGLQIYFENDTIVQSFTPEFVFDEGVTEGQFRWGVLYDFGNSSGSVSLSNTLTHIANSGDTIDLTGEHYLNNRYSLFVAPVTTGMRLKYGNTSVYGGSFKDYFINISLDRINIPNWRTFANKVPAGTYVIRTYSMCERVDTLEAKTALLEDATLKGSAAPYIAKYGNRVREVDLSSYLFNDTKTTQIAFFNTETGKTNLGCPLQTVYAGARIGNNILYLPKGSIVITNVDSVYDLSTMVFTNFNIGNQRGIILANYHNNGETVLGTIAYGREKFDGVFREIPITYTDYYCLSYRTDVSYTNKLYIYYPDDKGLLPNGIGVTDITSDIRMQDGWIQYAGNGNWYNLLIEGNGSAGRYHTKSTFLHLTGNTGKSLYVDGMTLYDNNTGAQTVIRYVDNGDGTYTPDAENTIIRPEYTIAKHNYITVPLTEKDDIRIQFSAKASPAYVRFLIVPNELLYEHGLANPVFYGKKIIGFGDSYIAGQSASFTWHYVLSQENYGTYVNKGYGGAGLCFGANGSLMNHLSDLDENADIYFLCFGRNDSSTDIQIGENDDELDTSVEWDAGYLINTATFKGAMNYLFNYIETRHPFAKIITVTPWGFENNPGVTSGLSCLDYIDAMQEMSKKWGITCFNAAGDAGIHVRIAAFRSQYFLSADDQSHLNNDGHLLMAGRAQKLLTNLLYDD